MPVPKAQAPTRRSRLRDDVYSRLRSAIVDGTLSPGEKLKDTELEGWLGVSRTPIREAIQRLERDGLVETRPNKSTLVSPFDPAATENARNVVASLHELATRLALPRLVPSDFKSLEDAHSAFETALDRDDAEAALQADDRFHAVFVRASGNELIADLLDQVTPTLRRVERLRFSSTAARESVKHHARILQAARKGDTRAAIEATRENWESLAAEG